MERFPLEQFQAEDGVSHTIWGIDDPKIVKWTIKVFMDKTLLIADGHHRYQTALNLSREWSEGNQDESGDEPYRYVMMLLWQMEDQGITLLPVHRMIHDSPECRAAAVLRYAGCRGALHPVGGAAGQRLAGGGC